MIDKDDSGTLDKAEVVDAVKNDKKVIKFLCNCGNQNLQYLLVPSRLDKALAEMDTDRDGSIDADEWEQCIEIALQNKLAARAAKRELDAKNAAKEIAAFTSDFLNAARKCFNLIDKDMSGTLEIDEIIQAVKTDQVAHAASYDRAPFNLRGLRGLCDRPSRHHFLSTRRRSSSFWRPAASRTCSFWSGRRRSGGRCACST